jgi:prolyl oligopeptidase
VHHATIRRVVPAFVALTSLAVTTIAGPPPSRIDPVTDVYHGVEVVDDYRWLEGGTEAWDAEVDTWTDKQNAYTRSVLDDLPGRPAIEARLRELMTVGSISRPTMRGDRYFFTKREGDQNQPILYLRRAGDDEASVLLDPNSLHEDGLISLDWVAPNHDGTLLAFGTSLAGDEMSTLHIMEVDTGRWLPDEIPNRAGSVQWFPDSKGFIYDALSDPDDPYSGVVRYHEIGTHRRHDIVLWEQFSETWGPWVTLSRDGRWMIAGYWTGTNSNDLWVVDADHWRRTGEFNRVPIAVGLPATFEGPVAGDTLYLRTTHEHPNGIIYAVDLNRPQQANWKVCIPEQDDAILQGVQLARGMMVARYMKQASTYLEKRTLDGEIIGPIDLPGIGSAGLSTNEDRTEAFLAFESFDRPQTIYHVDLATGHRELWASLDVPVDPDLVDVTLKTYESADGTPVTMFVVHRKGLRRTGDRPTIILGYGGFDVPQTPFFWSTMFPFLEKGGVVAIPHLRGGGEYGAEWHRAGMLESKQNTFDDFIAAAEWLIEQRYTDSDHIAIYGGSNGGLSVGAVLVQRPELVRAVVCGVPLLDMLRYQNFLMARYWVPEYGSSEDPEQFEFIYAYSPYHHIHEGVRYPAVFLDAGENDSRVHPLHARKMAAALQHATASDPDERPVLLWIDRTGGHGQGKPFTVRLREVVDVHCFFQWQLGMIEDAD